MTLKQLEKEYTTRKLHQTYLRGGLNGLIDLLDVVEKLEEDCIEKWTREDVQLCWDIQEDIFIQVTLLEDAYDTVFSAPKFE